jgi:hypothetical protein
MYLYSVIKHMSIILKLSTLELWSNCVNIQVPIKQYKVVLIVCKDKDLQGNVMEIENLGNRISEEWKKTYTYIRE